MLQKKFAAFLLTGMLTAAVVCIPALASTSETAPAASATPATTAYPVCTQNGCSKTYDHTHDGTWYEGHHSEDCSKNTDSTCTQTHSGTHHTGTSQTQTHHSETHHSETQASTSTQTAKTTSGHGHHSHGGNHH